MFYKHLPEPAQFPCRPEVVFVDSGGYEISTDRDYASVVDSLPEPEPWSIERLEEVLAVWPEEMPAVFVSFDHPDEKRGVRKQVEDAHALFRHCPDHLKLLLIKPETSRQTTLRNAVAETIRVVRELARFDIVGVTEKELGTTMLERMILIAKLRKAMDDADVSAPIHVFGALDPLSVCLYFLAGAEIFDGLTWLRYAYKDGLCVYHHNYGVVEHGLKIRDRMVKTKAMVDNIYHLADLQRALYDFQATKDFSKLEPHAEISEQAWDSLRVRLTRTR